MRRGGVDGYRSGLSQEVQQRGRFERRSRRFISFEALLVADQMPEMKIRSNYQRREKNIITHLQDINFYL
ncbi:hypothetical protein EYF80_028263 [Liparis tanakae]|uniref:Uncharacterized protein n=1 Tax=Liparis tanakae TaxID=230148 RepID=A0A4Z2H6I6_9TELE|nr:hypothetical protein EYF80_028263 [Liparis tanakae]